LAVLDVTRRPVTLSLKDDMTVESIGKRLSRSDDISQQVLQYFWCFVLSLFKIGHLFYRTTQQICRESGT